MAQPDLRQLEADLRRQSLEAIGRGVNDPALAPTVGTLSTVRTLLEVEREETERRRRRQFGMFTFAVGIVLVFASLMRVRTADVDLQLVTSGATLQSRASQPFTGLISVRELVLSGSSRITAPAEFGAWPAKADLRLTAVGEPIVIEPIDIGAGDHVAIERVAAERYRLTIDSARAMELAFSLVGKFEAVSETRSALLTLAAPRQLSASWDAGAQVSLTFATDARALTRPILIDGIELQRVESNGRTRRTVSSILSGDVAFPEFHDKVYAIRPGERVLVSGFEGRATAITARDETLAFTITGTARSLEHGLGATLRSLFPSALEYVATSFGWMSVWTGIGAIIALVAAFWPVWTTVR